MRENNGYIKFTGVRERLLARCLDNSKQKSRFAVSRIRRKRRFKSILLKTSASNLADIRRNLKSRFFRDPQIP